MLYRIAIITVTAHCTEQSQHMADHQETICFFTAGAAAAANFAAAIIIQVWSTRGVEGVHRFLNRVYRAFEAGVSATAAASVTSM